MMASPTPSSAPPHPSPPSALKTIGLAGLVAGILDIAYIIIYYAIKGVDATRVLQGVSAGLIGREAASRGGTPTALLGLGLHFVIAFGAAATFYVASRRLWFLVKYPWIAGPLYGVAVWLFMNLVVLPLSANPPKTFPSGPWIVVLIAHLLCVGLPIVWVVRRFGR